MTRIKDNTGDSSPGNMIMSNNVNPGDRLRCLYEMKYGCSPSVVPLAGAGSERRYYRMSAPEGADVIGTYGPDARENRAFVQLSGIFEEAGVNVPRVLAADDGFSCYLQDDLGDVALLALLGGEKRMELSAKALQELVRMQTVDRSAWKGSVMCSPFSSRQVKWDLNYFKYEFLKPAGIMMDEDLLEDDFEKLAASISRQLPELTGFMYRDFQSRNVMVKDDVPWLIDFQGGREGPLLYDAVSFLWQAKAGFSDCERRELLGVYASALGAVRGLAPDMILADVGGMALLRTLQVLGAYGFRGLVEKKAHFIESIPQALGNLESLLREGDMDAYPELRKVVSAAVGSRFAQHEERGGLTIKVFSFSYKKGYPEDLTGNGGGFMFDCRGMHNPGRYAQYKSLTGLDREVSDFLEERGEVQPFVQQALAMVSPSVACYLRRGFSNLQIGFGCTGGQHRSVYCAESVGRSLAEKFPEAHVEIIHREQGLIREV